MSKYQVGQRVYLFNSLAMRIESDEVYAELRIPVLAEGKSADDAKGIGGMVKEGIMVVKEQYQLAKHQGVLDEDMLFASEEDCKAWFRKFFAE